MTTPISPDDWEILSAFLDGQVSVREKDQLRLRLDSDPELQHALEDLRRTRMVLRSVPRKRVPHNFTLTQAMLPKRKSWFSLVPTLGFASGLATFLLVLTFTFQFLPGLANVTQPPAAAAPLAALSSKQSPSLPFSAQDQNSAAENQGAPLVIWGTGATGLGGGGGGGGGGGSGQEIIPPDAAVETPAGGIGGGPTSEPAQVEGTPVPPTETPTPASSSIQATPEPFSGNSPILGIRPTEDMGKIVIDQGADLYSNQAAAEQPAPAREPSFLARNLVPIQIGLVLLALAAGFAAVYLRRRL